MFLNEWKKTTNIVPIHKKIDKQIVTNYRFVFLLPVWNKIFERTIYNAIYKHTSDSKLLSPNRSGVCRGDSCINQLLSITRDILSDCNWARTQNHLVCKRTLNHLAIRLRIKWFWVRVQLQSFITFLKITNNFEYLEQKNEPYN